MKLFRILPIILVVMLIFCSCAITGEENVSVATGENTLTIVTSFYPMYIFTKNITKDIDGVNVVNMAQSQTGCLHDYQMTPADMKKVEKADIMVINSVDMETFIEKIINDRPQLKVIEAGKGLEFITEECHDEGGHEHHDEAHDDEEHGETEHEGHDHDVNPHLWVSISGAIDEVKNIGEQLAIANPANGEAYRRNTDEYVKKLEEQKEKMHKALEGIENRNIVTFHEAFPYFANEFNLNIVEVIQTNEGSSPSAGELADKIKRTKESGVKALFSEPNNPTNLVHTVSKETGIKVYELDPITTGEEEPELDAYVKAMDKNLEVLLEALQ